MELPYNILWIMTNQQRYDCVSCFGQDYVATPNIDSIAGQGVCFDRHYTSSPLCAPARASLATGRYSHNCGSTVNAVFWPEHGEMEHATINRDEITVGQRLADAGYRVSQVGVDHVYTDPRDLQRKAFDDFYSFSDYEKDYYPLHGAPGYNAKKHVVKCHEATQREAFDVSYSGPIPGQHPLDKDEFIDFVLARRAADFLSQTEDDHPWALFCYLWAPHPPLVWPKPYCNSFSPQDIDLPPNVGVTGRGQTRLHETHGPGQTAAVITERDQWKPTWAAYLGGCQLVDEAIGVVLEAARRRSDWDRTLVVFLSDHGEQLGAHKCFQKMVCYEESIHVPMIICDPRASTRGQRTGELTSHIDIAPTILDYAGQPIASNVQGLSLRSLVNEPGAPLARDAVFCEYNGNVGWNYHQRCVVIDRWKYIDNIGVDQELYDLKNDPYEMDNVIDTAPNDILASLRERLSEWMTTTDDFLLDQA